MADEKVTVFYAQVKVLRSELSTNNELLAPWEIPVLQAAYPEGAVREEGPRKPVEVEAVDAKAEMDRLIKRYGIDTESGTPYAVAAYGMGQMGMRNLESEIKRAMKPPKSDPLAA